MEWINQHTIAIMIAWYVYNSAIQALPRPTETSRAWYVWMYSFTHLLAGNLALFANPRNFPRTATPPEAK